MINEKELQAYLQKELETAKKCEVECKVNGKYNIAQEYKVRAKMILEIKLALDRFRVNEELAVKPDELKSMQATVMAALSERELLEGLAEEAGEMIQAAMKLIRAKGISSSRTPVQEGEALKNLREEIVDTSLYMQIILHEHGFGYNLDMEKEKMQRWIKRIEG